MRLSLVTLVVVGLATIVSLAAIPPAVAQGAPDEPLQLAWFSSENDKTLGVAWGDYDNDGDLDLAVANGGDAATPQPSRIYANLGDALSDKPAWTTPTSGNTYSVAWGDYDNDGDLDLALGQVGVDVLYRNDGPGPGDPAPRFALAWSGQLDDFTRSVAWGDYDNDGDLDLAAGNVGAPKRIYRNDGGTLATTPAWESVEVDNTWSLAWGDYDGDGDLDLAAGNGGRSSVEPESQPSRLYRNDGGTLTSSAVWQSAPADTHQLAWGDYDGDGDLDLAVAHFGFGQSTLLYRTVDGALEGSPVWRSFGSYLTTSLAWGDYDGDGDPDLALGNESGPTQLVLNEGGTLKPIGYLWQSTEQDSTTSLAWGDYDGDGDLDLVTGAYFQPLRLYRNSAALIATMPLGVENTTSIVWEDYDGDGDPDLLTGNGGTIMGGTPSDLPERLYRNEGGVLSSLPVWESGRRDQTTSVAWGDYDRDGDKDLFVANYDQPGRLYRNDGGVLTRNPVWESPPMLAMSVVWVDYNRDAWLDLVIGGFSFVSYSKSFVIYRNFGLSPQGVPLFGLIYASPTTDSSTSVAVADFDQDGDADLALGNLGLNVGAAGEANRLYRNDGPGPDGLAHQFTLIWSSAEADPTTSVAWGSLDGDQYPDLAVGNVGQPVRVYRNTGTSLTGAAIWSAELAENTSSVAWADVNGDGYHDLIVGNVNAPNHIYLNREGQLEPRPSWSSDFARETRSVALADMDGDGDLDLAAGNAGWPGQLYRNDAGGLDSGRSWVVPDAVNNYSAAWGDVDGDGDLDLAVGKGAFFNDGPASLQSELFTSDAGWLSREPVWRSDEQALTTSLAWGDYDNDGDLDLALGNGGYSNVTGANNQPERLYRNDNGTLTAAAVWTSELADATYAVAWGDYDGDGDLDLLVGNTADQPIRLYRNDGASLTGRPVWESPSGNTTHVAWGDYDSDGDLDFVAADDGSTRLFRNDGLAADGLTPRFTLVWSPQERGNSWRAAWGDYDGDGDLDLALAYGEGQGQPNRLYRNDQGELTTRAVWRSNETDLTYGLAWGDADNDGDLDLAAVNGGAFVLQPPRLYRNDGGGLTQSSVWKSLNSGLSADLSWGDYDRDGDLDLAVADIRRPLAIYRNSRTGAALRSQPPTLELQRAGRTPGAGFYATPDILSGPTIPLTFTLTHPRGAVVQRVIGQYSLDGGGRWLPAVAANASGLSNLPATPEGASYSYSWDLFASGVFGRNDNVVFRLLAVPAVTAGRGEVPGPFLYGAQSAVTPPFRVRGTQVQVRDERGEALAGAYVYRLPAGQTRGSVLADSQGRVFQTDPRGFLQGRGTLAISDTLVALYPVAATASYTMYLTSAAPSRTGLDGFVVREPGVQTLAVAAAHPLVLLNLDLALEWDARGDPQFLAQLEYDLQRTSELLYDWTDGQIALGDLRVFHDRERWNEAHIRIYATNQLRPNANQGGIVAEPLPDPDRPTVEYEPGQVRIGAVWNRYGEAGGSLGEDWPRTLAHELGHFALFLDDNYLGLDEDGRLISIPARPDERPCRGAMSDPYRNDFGEFHPPGAAWDTACARTLSQLGTGRADWQTIKRFYDRSDLGVALAQPATYEANPGPSTLPLAVTRVAFQPLSRPVATLDAPIFNLSQDGSRAIAGAGARAVLFRRDLAGRISGVTDLGRPVLDQLTARGARTGDRLCVYEPRAARLGCEEVRPEDDRLDLVAVERTAWDPELRISPVTSRTIDLTVGGVPAGIALRAQLFPTFAVSETLPAEIALAPAGEGYAGRFTLATPTPEGLVRVWAEGPGPLREIVADYTLGGNPGFRRARNAPRGSPGFRRARNAPATSADGQAILYGDRLSFGEGEFVAVQAATRLPAPPPGRTLVGQGYWLSAAPATLDLSGASLNLGYLGRDVPAGAEEGLRLYFWDGQSWRPLATRLDAERNEASAPVVGPGLYALMASIDLHLSGPGWNLIAYPLRATRPVSEALVSIEGAYSIVYGYEPSDQGDPWRVYAPGAPDWVNDLRALEFGRGYWLHATEAITMYLPIDERPMTAAAAASLPPPPATYYALAPAPGLRVEARVNGALCGQGQTARREVAGQPRAVFVVKVRAAGPGADAACGTPGAPVQITLAEGARTIATYSTVWDNGGVRTLGGDRVFLPQIGAGRAGL